MAKGDFGKFLNILAYISIVLVAVALVLSKILGWAKAGQDIASAMQLVANILAYFITAIAAFYYVRSKKNIWFTIVYIVCLVLIIVFICLIGFNV